MRIMLSICTVLATASMAEAQLGSVTGTVQQTTDVENDELRLDQDSRLRSSLQSGQPASRLEMMRQQQAVREARRTAVAARESAGQDAASPQTNASVVTEVDAQADEAAQAAAQTQSAITAGPEGAGATNAASGQADAADAGNGQLSSRSAASIEARAAPTGTATSRVLTSAEIAANSARTEVTTHVPPDVNVQVQTPEAVVVSQGRSQTYAGPVRHSDTVIIRDRRVADDRGPATAAAQPRPDTAPQSATRPASRASDTMWVNRDSIREHAFPLSFALFLILSLLVAARLLAEPRRRRP
ncbi:hypothetical protein [Hyphobacterium indicum]|uniref:hypothetical protein n=1 Tax=Hyphobacterium indicum TaxID=2162714 RepID=UPI000D64B4DF|nr:hypothetical protein [Hyphobacterium indicum]